MGKAKAKGKAEKPEKPESESPEDAESESETPTSEAPETETPADEAAAETETPGEEPAAEEIEGGEPKAEQPAGAPAEETPATNPPAEGQPTIEGEPGETSLNDPVNEGMQENGDAMKYGAQMLAGAHAATSDMLSQIEAGVGPLENADAKAALTSFMEHEQEGLTLLEGAYSSCYPAAGPMPSKAKSVVSEDVQAEQLAQFIAHGQRAQHQFGGLVGRIAAVAKSKNITHEQRTLLNDVVRQFGGMAAKAKSMAKSAAQPKPAAKAALPADDHRASEQIEELRKSVTDTFDQLTDKIKSLMPANGTS